MRDYKRLEQKQVTEMNGHEIEELMFHACRGASDQLFYGLAKRFLFGIEEEIRQMHERLEKLELLVKMLIESKQEAKKEVNVEEWKPTDKSLVEAWKPNPELQKALEKVDKDALKKSLEEAMKVNTLRTIPMPKVEVPEFKKGANEE
ncbi:hypothetical protein [Saccharococcus thermophilus]|uniref:Putative Holliday junction resolvase-like endonuclease n=1 Tax=Saccharococcus thermophilus TaxID=29396 RepID=A0A846MFA2_9BACL|nr:hypothetical protein [Saccharococcus thermophilus]NIK15317.1 putative Holliday junction resolvase-like endonuclease [Saccharococcus thermophilus]